MYAMRESKAEGGVIFPRVAACAIMLVGFVMLSKRLLPVVMRRLVLKDKEKVKQPGLEP